MTKSIKPAGPNRSSKRRPKPAQEKTKAFPVVGIGASAGGLGAFEKFFNALPPKTGMAFVLVQHLDPNHESELASLLQNHTSIPVSQASEGERVEPDHAYVIPPGKAISIDNYVLNLSQPDVPRGRRVPIDLFFRSLAEDQPENSVCIILSGTGSDGSLGLKSVKEAGGVVMVQSPDDAEYDGMPLNAIGTGMVDIVAPAQELAKKLVEYHRTAGRIQLPSDVKDLPEKDSDILNRIFTHIKSKTGADFKCYKRSTILRRIQRRMQVNQTETMADYLRRLRTDDAEPQALFRDFLISVTNFFRDPEAFEQIEKKVIPQLISRRGGEETIRVWAAGCASGEEAYSLAILLAEQANDRDFQVFATDLDEEALAFARRGLYPEQIRADLSPERLKKFFVEEAAGFRIKKSLQEKVLFAHHDLLKDPPFGRLDLVSCRNVLIYLEREIQNRVLELFRYALRPSGYLFLGSSESADTEGLFDVVDKKRRIYLRNSMPMAAPPEFPASFPGKLSGQLEQAREETPSYADIHRDVVLSRIAPASVLVDQQYEIRHVQGGAQRFLKRYAGAPSNNLLQNVEKGLRLEIRAGLHQCFEKNARIEHNSVRWNDGRDAGVLDIVFEPVARADNSLAVVSFREVSTQLDNGQSAPEAASTDASVVEQLEDELNRTREVLRNTIEEYETSNEELKASNEEMQSVNEELRSTTEELETSKEELQSTNEELTTVNQELKNKVEELNRAHSDLSNLIANAEIATVFLDRDLHVKFFTPRFTSLYHIRDADVGRPLEHFGHRLQYSGLIEDARASLDRLKVVERTLVDESGCTYMTTLRPYRSIEDRIDGVVITFVDISEQVEAHQHAKLLNQRLELALDAASMGWWDYDLDTQDVQWSRALCRILGVDENVESRKAEDFLSMIVDDDRKEVEETLAVSLSTNTPFYREFRIQRPDGAERWLIGVGKIVEEGAGRRMVGVNVDVTDRKLTEIELHERALALSNAMPGILRCDAGGSITFVNEPMLEMLKTQEIHITSRPIRELFVDGDGEKAESALQTALAEGQVEFEAKLQSDTEDVHVLVLIVRPKFPGQEGMQVFVRDISERKRAEQQLEQANRLKDEFLGMLAHEIRNPLAAIDAGTALLRKADTNEEKREWTQKMIHRQTKHLGRLVDDLLDISRINRGVIELRKSRVDLRSVIDNACQIVRKSLPIERRTMETDLGDVPLYVEADADRIEQVVTNLLTNAVRYTGPTGSIQVRTFSKDEGVVVEVEDDGVGLAGEMLDRVFEPFVRIGENGKPSPGSGLGIGLSLVKKLTELHGGKVRAHSAGPGNGSMFSVVLPSAGEDSALSAGMDNSDEVNRAEPLVSYQLLLIDDNQDFNLGLKMHLESRGHQVKSVLTGTDGVQQAQQAVFDGIIIDIGLPDGDGRRFAADIRERLGDDCPPIIGVSGYRQEEDADPALELALTDRLLKPINALELENRLDRIKEQPAKDRGLTDGLNILVVDDNHDLILMITELLRTLGHQVTPALTGGEALEKAGPQAPDLVLCDLSLPDMDGQQVAQRLKQRYKDVKIVAVSGRSLSPLPTGPDGSLVFDSSVVKPMNLGEFNRLLVDLNLADASSTG